MLKGSNYEFLSIFQTQRVLQSTKGRDVGETLTLVAGYLPTFVAIATISITLSITTKLLNAFASFVTASPTLRTNPSGLSPVILRIMKARSANHLQTSATSI
jgi:predicted metal-binding membrane protein